MVQLSLPKNSKVKKGKYFKDRSGSKKAVVFDMGSVVDAENSDTTWVDTACQGLAN